MTVLLILSLGEDEDQRWSRRNSSTSTGGIPGADPRGGTAYIYKLNYMKGRKIDHLRGEAG